MGHDLGEAPALVLVDEERLRRPGPGRASKISRRLRRRVLEGPHRHAVDRDRLDLEPLAGGGDRGGGFVVGQHGERSISPQRSRWQVTSERVDEHEEAMPTTRVRAMLRVRQATTAATSAGDEAGLGEVEVALGAEEGGEDDRGQGGGRDLAQQALDRRGHVGQAVGERRGTRPAWRRCRCRRRTMAIQIRLTAPTPDRAGAASRRGRPGARGRPRPAPRRRSRPSAPKSTARWPAPASADEHGRPAADQGRHGRRAAGDGRHQQHEEHERHGEVERQRVGHGACR